MARQFNPLSLELYNRIGASPELNLIKQTISMNTSKSKRSSISSHSELSPKSISSASKSFFLTDYHRNRAVSATPYIESSVNPRIKSPIPLDKQLPRPDFTKNSYDVHQNRFVSFDTAPTIFTKVRHVGTPDIGKYAARDFKKIYGDLSEQPSYDPNFRSV